MDKDIRIGILVKKIHYTFETEINNELKKYDVTKGQFDILRYLDRNQDKKTTQRDLEKFYGISNPTVSGLLNRLETKDLIARSVSTEDARYKYIIQTDKAKAMHKTLRSHLDAKDKQLRQGLSEEEEKELLYLLQKLLSNISR